MKISVIIVHWNTPDALRTQRLKLRTYKDIEIILIDNNSTEENITKLKSYKLQELGYKTTYNQENFGFAKANNQGVKCSKGEWLMFLNPDTHINSENILKFVNKAEEQRLDAASLQPLEDNYLKPLPTPLSLLVEFSPIRRLVPLNIFRQKTLFGGGLLIKKSVLENLKGWDEKFFLWFEDSDLTKRLIDNGYKIGWVDVPYKHAGGTSFKKMTDQKKKDIFFTSMNLYSNKHFSFFGQLVVKFITFLNK